MEDGSKQKREKDLLQQCAADLCGPVTENLKYIYNNVIFDEADIEPEIIEKFDERIHHKVIANKDKEEKTYHVHDKYKTEEDMADLVAYQVFQDDPTLFTCNLFELYEKLDEYWGLRIVDPEYFSSTTNYDGVPHSEPLLRVIMEAILKRVELPESCQQVVDIQ